MPSNATHVSQIGTSSWLQRLDRVRNIFKAGPGVEWLLEKVDVVGVCVVGRRGRTLGYWPAGTYHFIGVSHAFTGGKEGGREGGGYTSPLTT